MGFYGCAEIPTLLVRYTDPQGVFQHLVTYIGLLSNLCDRSIEEAGKMS